MCRNIRVLFNFEPPAAESEIAAAALQYVRKVTGANAPSAANRAAFDRAVEEISEVTRRLVRNELSTTAAPRTREQEAERARERGKKRDQQQRVRLLKDFRPVEP